MDHESTLRSWSQNDQDRKALLHSLSSHAWLHRDSADQLKSDQRSISQRISQWDLWIRLDPS
eukprot:4879616-Amphidinium_carterae.5